jgi:5-formyltetrahydrofolate cyclo-ligase
VPSTLTLMSDTPPLPNNDKAGLRRTMAMRRAEAAAQNPDAPLRFCENFLKHISLPPHAVVAGYSTRQGEMDVAPLMDVLASNGYSLALPAISKRESPLVFRRYKKGDDLVPGSIGIPEPATAQPDVEPDVLLVPLLGFDATRHRLGMGGGYYDRTLAALRQKRAILAVGVCFSCQQIASVPAENHDIRLDRIVTEIEVF